LAIPIAILVSICTGSTTVKIIISKFDFFFAKRGRGKHTGLRQTEGRSDAVELGRVVDGLIERTRDGIRESPQDVADVRGVLDEDLYNGATVGGGLLVHPHLCKVEWKLILGEEYTRQCSMIHRDSRSRRCKRYR